MSTLPAASATLRVRLMTCADLPFTAHLHHCTLSHGLFPALGIRFLEAYHRSFIRSPAAVALVITKSGDRVGFLLGTLDQPAHYSYVVRHHGLRLSLTAVAAMIRRPRLAFTFMQTRATRYARGIIRLAVPHMLPHSRSTHDSVAVLEHVAVMPYARAAGTGAVLVDDFVRRVRAARVSTIQLITRADASGAAGFYDKLKWSRMEILTDGEGVAWQRFQLRQS